MSTFNYNKIIILQSLTEEDKPTGTCLATNLNNFAIEKGINFTAEVREIHSLQDWITTWHYIRELVLIKHDTPIIHLDMHGNKQGIGIDKGAGGTIPYNIFYNTIRWINMISKNNIFLSMAVCEGMNVILSMDTVFAPMPFFGILASEDILFEDTLVENYTIFYTHLLTRGNLNNAEEVLQKEDNDNAKKLKVFTPEQLFTNMYASYLISYDTREKCAERAISAAKDYGLTLSSQHEREKFIEDFTKLLIITEDNQYKKTMRQFFMFDIYPDIEDRFNIPKTIKDFRAFAGLQLPSFYQEFGI